MTLFQNEFIQDHVFYIFKLIIRVGILQRYLNTSILYRLQITTIVIDIHLTL